MSEVIVDTYKLNQYAQRISKVQSRVTKLDNRMDRLYFKVGLQGLFDLMEADALVGFNFKLLFCQSYLSTTADKYEQLEKHLREQDIENFTPPKKEKPDVSVLEQAGQGLVNGFGKAIKKCGKAVKSTVKNITKAVDDLVDVVVDDYNSQGVVYRVVQYGKATVKAGIGVAKLTKSACSIIATGGLSSPVEVLSIISGINDVANGVRDIYYTANREYDKLGQNLLKDTLAEGGGFIGEKLGNREMGENIGKVVYFGVELVPALSKLSTSYDKIKQANPTKFSALGKEVKDIAKIDMSGIFTTDMRTLVYQSKLASYTYAETTNFVKNAGLLYDVGKNTFDVGKATHSIFTVGSDDSDNESIDFLDGVFGKIDGAKDIFKYTGKATKFVLR